MEDKNTPNAIEREVARLVAEGRQKRGRDFLKDFATAAFDKAVAFNAVIMSAGYVGEFALWDRSKAGLTYPERMLIISLLTISLLIFIGWHIKGQMTIAFQQLRFTQFIGAIDADNESQVKELQERFRLDAVKSRAFSQRHMPFFVGSAIAFAALAALVMLIECLRHMAAGS